MDRGGRKQKSGSAFGWATLSTEQDIEHYLIECRKTGNQEIIRDAEYLAALAREKIAMKR